MGRFDLYCQALDSANKLLELAKGLLLTGEPAKTGEEITRFAKMVQQRDPIVKKIVQLRQQALAFPEDSDKEKSDAKWEAVKKVINEITAEEKKIMTVVEQMKASVTASIKETRDSVKLNKGYTVSTMDLVRSRLDVKN